MSRAVNIGVILLFMAIGFFTLMEFMGIKAENVMHQIYTMILVVIMIMCIGVICIMLGIDNLHHKIDKLDITKNFNKITYLLEALDKKSQSRPEEPKQTKEKTSSCPQCRHPILRSAIESGLRVCPSCKNQFSVE